MKRIEKNYKSDIYFIISTNFSFLDPANMTYYQPIQKKKKVTFIEKDVEEKMGPFFPMNSTK